jgi:PiT family inorganic phosphate transporter
MSLLTLMIVVIALALLFDFINGFHDAANSVATLVFTRVLTPGQAVLMAGIANFLGYLIFGMAIAKAIEGGIIHIDHATLPVILAALIGAIMWSVITWLWGLPTSSSHTLIGGLIGSGIAAAGLHAVIWPSVLKIGIFIFIAPLIGMTGAIIFTAAILWLFRKTDQMKTKGLFNILQVISSFAYSISHGTNDAQKAMGIIALALLAGGMTKSFELPHWVALSCYGAIALGTMFGGWRIVKTMGDRITKLETREGFCAETSSTLVLLGTALLGIPVSTTQVIAGSIVGVGVVPQASKVRWITARKIVWAWILTIPLTALCAGVCYFIISLFLRSNAAG